MPARPGGRGGSVQTRFPNPGKPGQVPATDPNQLKKPAK